MYVNNYHKITIKFIYKLFLFNKKIKLRWGGDLNSCGDKSPIALEATALDQA
jgi:hypothetical protein